MYNPLSKRWPLFCSCAVFLKRSAPYNVSGSVQSPPFCLLALIYHDLFFFHTSVIKFKCHKPASTLVCAAALAVRAGARLAVRAEHKSLLEITVGGGRRVGVRFSMHQTPPWTWLKCPPVSAAWGNSFYPRHESEISCVVIFFAKPGVLRSPNYLVMLLCSVLISCVGRSPKSLLPPYPTLFLPLMSVQELCFHKSGLRLKYEALVAKQLGKGISF